MDKAEQECRASLTRGSTEGLGLWQDIALQTQASGWVRASGLTPALEDPNSITARPDSCAGIQRERERQKKRDGDRETETEEWIETLREKETETNALNH